MICIWVFSATAGILRSPRLAGMMSKFFYDKKIADSWDYIGKVNLPDQIQKRFHCLWQKKWISVWPLIWSWDFDFAASWMKQSSQAHILTVIELDGVDRTFYQLAFYNHRSSRQFQQFCLEWILYGKAAKAMCKSLQQKSKLKLGCFLGQNS